MSEAIKFPKTPRLTEVMREDVPAEWRDAHAIVEEKVDGANVGLWIDTADLGVLRLQSRGHILRGGAGEEQFSALHRWAAERLDVLRETLTDRYVLYGEWCFAKHRAFYDALPDWFLGIDVLDRTSGKFLGAMERNRIMAVCRVRPVVHLWSGRFMRAPAFGSFLGPSRYKTDKWRDALSTEAALRGNIHFVREVWRETDDSNDAEGVYVRVELDGYVVGRMKAHRPGFEKVRSDTWNEHAIVRNRVIPLV